MERPMVSIIMPAYNSEAYISKAIESVINQTFKNWELIVIDDNSTDASLEVATLFQEKDQRIKLTKLKENNGAAYCRNLATDLANGTYIAFLDSDDLWHQDKLEKQLYFMQKNDCKVSFTSYLKIDQQGKSLNIKVDAMPKLTYKKQLKNNYIGNLTGIYNAAFLGKIKAPNIRKRQDWAVWLEAIKRNGKPALGLQKNLAFYRVHKGSISSNKLNLLKYNFMFYRKHLGYSWLQSFWHLILFLFEYTFVRPTYIQKLH